MMLGIFGIRLIIGFDTCQLIGGQVIGHPFGTNEYIPKG